MNRTRLAALALTLAAAPLAAQPPETTPPPPPEQGATRNMEGEAIGYLAVPALLILVVLIGVLIGSGGEEDMPVSP